MQQRAAAAGDEASTPAQDEPPASRDTFWPCVANLSKVIVGAGMMAIPQAYCRIGSLAGTSMLLLVGGLTYTTLVALLQGSAATGAATYSQLTQQLCGSAVMKVLQLAVLAFCFGFGVVYLVIIRDILLGTPPACNGLLCELFGLPTSSVLYDGRLLLLLLALLVCCPLLLLRSMDRLAVLNVVGVGAIAMLALTALGLGAKGLVQGTAHTIPLWPQWQQLGHTRAEQVQALAAVLPVMIACYVAHQSLHPLMPLLRPYSDARMRRVIAAALLVAFGVFGSLAVGSGLAFGPTVEVNVLSNYSVAGLQPLTGLMLARALSWAIRGGYLISLLASFCLYMHPLRACLAEMIWPDTVRPQNNTDESVGLLSPGVADNTRAVDGIGPGFDSRQQGSMWAGNKREGTAAGRVNAPAGQQGQQARGSAFATPAAQAGAAAAAGGANAAGGRGSSGGGSGFLSGSSSSSRQLTTFDSLDNPRTGSWSGVRYLAMLSPRFSQQQQQQQQQQRVGQDGSVGSSSSSAGLPTHTIEHGQQQQQQQQQQGRQAAESVQQQSSSSSVVHIRDGIEIHISDAGSRLLPQQQQVRQQQQQQQAAGSGAAACSSWREQEQRWYYALTYGLEAAMVLVAIAVPNIWTALSAIGDLASTIQAFVVPGLIGLVLMRHTKVTNSSGVLVRLQHAASGGVGALAVFLGLALFVNGMYQRV